MLLKTDSFHLLSELSQLLTHSFSDWNMGNFILPPLGGLVPHYLALSPPRQQPCAHEAHVSLWFQHTGGICPVLALDASCMLHWLHLVFLLGNSGSSPQLCVGIIWRVV
jgi:hypothetical protein